MIINQIKKFIEDRNWSQFHTPANLAKSIVIESAELLENFQWDDQYDLEQVTQELADVLIYSYQLAISLDLDAEKIIEDKMRVNEKKYPIEKAKNSSKKYTEFS